MIHGSRAMSDIPIHRVVGKHDCFVLEHPFDLSVFDLPLVDRGYSSWEEAEQAAASLLAAVAGGPD
jgi:hypothetical protein